MKKVLFVCDGDNYSHGSFEFIKLMRQTEPISVKALFFSSLEISASITGSYSPRVYDEIVESDNNTRGAIVERFINQCQASDIQQVHSYHNPGSWNKSFWEKETGYADLMILSQELLGAAHDRNQPNIYMLELLRWAECPVLTVPEAVQAPKYIIGANDGSAESVHALTQFCKLFPQYESLPAQFIYIKDEYSNTVPDKTLLTEYINAHFKNAQVMKLHWDRDKNFVQWIECHENPLLITGAFGRSALSNLLQRSFAEQVIYEHAAPVFIAH